MSFQQRLFLAVFLCLGIYMVFDLFFPAPVPVEGEGDTDGLVDAGTAGETGMGESGDGDGTSPSPSDGGPASPEGPDAGPDAAPEAAPEGPAQTDIELVEHRLQNELVAIDVSNDGWGLVRDTELLSDQFLEADGVGLDFLLLGDDPSLELGFDPEQTSFALPAGTRGEVVEKSERRFVVRQRTDDVEVVQTLELLEDYELTYDVEIINRGTSEIRQALRVRNRMGQEAESSRYNIHRALCQTADDLEEYDDGDLEDGPQRIATGVTWTALTSQYFGHVLVPTTDGYGCEASRSSDGQFLFATLIAPAEKLGPGETSHQHFGMYMGAKNQHRLENFSVVPGAGLEYAIDWGWFGALSRSLGGLLFDLLRWIHSLVGVWGVAIIILTAIVKLTTLPLTLKQMSSMKRMKEIQPEIEKIKKKYGEDRVKQSQEMQALFQRTGVNPLAGCLPMVVQMPIWFALYSMLSAVVELYHEHFLWLPDLTKPDPFYVLPAAMGALMFVQTRIQPTAADNQQAKMMQWMMPGIFTVMMLFLPSGLGIYIFANIVLSLIQTFIQLRPDKKSATAAAK
jgi:YidC/Oxa1 family membrane protein insertase